jgi:Family of unknown function (DUF6230)
MVPTVVVVGALGAGIASGAVPVSFAVSGSSFTVTADKLTGTNFVQYGAVVTGVNKSDPTQTHLVAESGISNAQLTNLCQSVAVPGVNGVYLRLTAGDKGTPASATNLIIDMSQLNGTQATFTNINIGQDASTLNDGTTDTVGQQTIVRDGSNGAAGGFGQRADLVEIDGLRQTAWATSAGTFTLPNLSLGFGGTC